MYKKRVISPLFNSGFSNVRMQLSRQFKTRIDHKTTRCTFGGLNNGFENMLKNILIKPKSNSDKQACFSSRYQLHKDFLSTYLLFLILYKYYSFYNILILKRVFYIILLLLFLFL